MIREIPPTAGLPLKWSDLMAGFLPHSKPSNSVFESVPNDGSSRRFEDLLASFLGLDCLDLYSSGTLCLSIAFETAKEASGRNKVVLPAYTCPLVAIAAHAAGMEIVLCDTLPDSFEMDLNVLEKVCDSTVAAVVPVDIGGLPAGILPVKELASSKGAYTIEDAAQALGARRDDKPAGSLADMSVYSLAVGKGLSLYDGGMLFVADETLRQRSRELAKQRAPRKPLMNLQRQLELFGLWLLYNPLGLHFAYGNELRHYLKQGDPERAVGDVFDLEIPAYEFEEFRKKVGAAAVFRLPEFIAQNRKRALARAELIRLRAPGLHVLTEPSASEGSWPFIMLLSENMQVRDALMSKLWTAGLGVTRLFIHELSAYKFLEPVLTRQAEVPNAKAFAERSFSISNSHWLRDADFEVILSVLEELACGKNFSGIGA